MKKARSQEDDIFVRKPMANLRAKLSRFDMDIEAALAVLEPFMEATVAAAMIIAHADGDADQTERQRILSLFRADPHLRGFSAIDISHEINSHTQAFDLEEHDGLAKARAKIGTADLSALQFQTLIKVCIAVLDADGVRHPQEEQALADIASMRPWGYR